MKIEILFPEMCNLFGDLKSMDYLSLCLPDAEFVRTSYMSEPLFATETPSLIYMGPMTESAQEKVIQKLLPYKDRIVELIDNGALFLFTGNAVEVLGKYIENDDNTKINALDIFPFYAKRKMMNRHNSNFIGTFEDETIIGFKSQFSMAYPTEDIPALMSTQKGVGLNENSKQEGIRKNFFFATYILGPMLILNPAFTKKLIGFMGVQNPTLAFEDDVFSAYKAFLNDFNAKA